MRLPGHLDEGLGQQAHRQHQHQRKARYAQGFLAGPPDHAPMLRDLGPIPPASLPCRSSIVADASRL